MAQTSQIENLPSTKKLVDDIINYLDKEREKEIISRRFGLFDRKETLEQIGEMLGITRERVRQLEKYIIEKLKTEAKAGKLNSINTFQEIVIPIITERGELVRITDLTQSFSTNVNKLDYSRVSFLVQLSPKLQFIDDDEYYYSTALLGTLDLKKDVKEPLEVVIKTIKENNKPITIKSLAEKLNYTSSQLKQLESLASISKQLANLNNQWGLVKWPTVNPKNIRDKIYVILKENGKHMHFSEIAEAIRQSDFKRNNVTTQAIHNELIKDKRFVLIGRGIYALREWGYKNGTVSDIITEVLKEASQPLHRDEIVKKVLESRFVKETTVLLNLQGKPQFKRVSKATYELNEDV
jgi:hypothetical protein